MFSAKNWMKNKKDDEREWKTQFHSLQWLPLKSFFNCFLLLFYQIPFFFLLILSLSLNQSVSFCWPKSLQPISHFQLPMADLKFSFAETFLCSAFAACFAEVFTIYWCKFIMCSFYFFLLFDNSDDFLVDCWFIGQMLTFLYSIRRYICFFVFLFETHCFFLRLNFTVA